MNDVPRAPARQLVAALAMLAAACAVGSGNAAVAADAVNAGVGAASAAADRPPPDPATAARKILGVGQGVYVEAADGTVLVAQAASRAVQPASVSKVPSTLALLAKLGPEYRFETHFAWSAPIVDGALDGDLDVRSDGDVALVDEDALLVAAHLNELGIRRIAGAVRTHGSLIFDWQPDPQGARLQQALSGQVSEAARQAVSPLPAADRVAARDGPDEPIEGVRPAVAFAATPWRDARIAPAALTASSAAGRELVYRSQPLLALLKSLNDYSNNIFDSLVDAIGGAAAVQALVRSRVPADLRDEITLADAAGADPRNRLSPRVAVRLLRALEGELATTGHTLSDVLPVAGVDTGTLEARIEGSDLTGRVVGKTGTYGSYGASALIGAIRTLAHGTVYFAILDHGVPVPEARRRQDRFVRALLARYRTEPWPYRRDLRSAVARAEIEVREQKTVVSPGAVSH